MKVLRDTRYLYEGITKYQGELFLMFRNLMFRDEIIFCKRAKYVTVKDNKVTILSVDPPADGSSRI